QTIHRAWCPLLSYNANLGRVRDALLDTETAQKKLGALFQAGQSQFRGAARSGGFRRQRRPGGGFFIVPAPPSPPPPPPPSAPPPPPPPRPAGSSTTAGPDPGQPASYPWQWSAGVLAGLAALSVWILATRVRSLDRLR